MAIWRLDELAGGPNTVRVTIDRTAPGPDDKWYTFEFPAPSAPPSLELNVLDAEALTVYDADGNVLRRIPTDGMTI